MSRSAIVRALLRNLRQLGVRRRQPDVEEHSRRNGLVDVAIVDLANHEVAAQKIVVAGFAKRGIDDLDPYAEVHERALDQDYEAGVRRGAGVGRGAVARIDGDDVAASAADELINAEPLEVLASRKVHEISIFGSESERRRERQISIGWTGRGPTIGFGFLDP